MLYGQFVNDSKSRATQLTRLDSELEINNTVLSPQVYLQKKDSVGCIFRLHPHIKVQTIGEEVNYDDQIKFESVATEGQYLHCSRKTFGDVNIPVLSEWYILKHSLYVSQN